ncbi:hypothetical protein F4814DRAFT_422964 [Daldinia grandis]|nr:hypothetical protein F4814DRAFT_422964 [Daldinia grandis]
MGGGMLDVLLSGLLLLLGLVCSGSMGPGSGSMVVVLASSWASLVPLVLISVLGAASLLTWGLMSLSALDSGVIDIATVWYEELVFMMSCGYVCLFEYQH